MQPHMLAEESVQPSRLNRMSKAFSLRAASLLAMLAMLVPSPSTDAVSGVASRRAMLALAREESANVDAMKDIAVSFILLALALVIALAFWPIITSSVKTATNDANTSTTQGTLLGLIPTVLVAVLLIGSIGFLIKGIHTFRTN